LGPRKSGILRDSFHKTFSVTGQEKSDLLIQVTAWSKGIHFESIEKQEVVLTILF
jgi:hypothetical protein